MKKFQALLMAVAFMGAVSAQAHDHDEGTATGGTEKAAAAKGTNQKAGKMKKKKGAGAEKTMEKGTETAAPTAEGTTPAEGAPAEGTGM